MSKDRLLALGAGIACAILYLAVISGNPGGLALAYFAQLPLYLVGLSFGLVPGLIAGGIALVAILAATPIAAFGLFFLFNVGPALLVVRQAMLAQPRADGSLEWYPPGLLLGWLTGAGLLMLAVAWVMLLSVPGGLEDAAKSFISERVIGRAGPTLANGGVAEAIARIMPALVVLSWLIMVMVNATMAQSIVTRLGANARPTPPYGSLELPGWLTICAVFAAAAALAPGSIGYLGRNALLIIGAPFFLLGLTVIHAITRRVTARLALLVLFYTLLVVLGWPAVLIAGLGFAERWLGLRTRFGPPDKGEEFE